MITIHWRHNLDAVKTPDAAAVLAEWRAVARLACARIPSHIQNSLPETAYLAFEPGAANGWFVCPAEKIFLNTANFSEQTRRGRMQTFAHECGHAYLQARDVGLNILPECEHLADALCVAWHFIKAGESPTLNPPGVLRLTGRL